MSKQRTHFRSCDEDRAHEERRLQKLQKIQSLKALLESWEAHSDPDYDYLRELRARLRSAQVQFDAMKL